MARDSRAMPRSSLPRGRAGDYIFITNAGVSGLPRQASAGFRKGRCAALSRVWRRLGRGPASEPPVPEDANSADLQPHASPTIHRRRSLSSGMTSTRRDGRQICAASRPRTRIDGAWKRCWITGSSCFAGSGFRQIDDRGDIVSWRAG